MFQKAIVIGCPGGGKSTFAQRLRDLTDLPLYYLDMLWHRPDGTNVSREEFDAGLGRILREDMPWVEASLDPEFRQWILDFPRDQLPRIYELLRKYRTDTAEIVFRSRREAEDWLSAPRTYA